MLSKHLECLGVGNKDIYKFVKNNNRGDTSSLSLQLNKIYCFAVDFWFSLFELSIQNLLIKEIFVCVSDQYECTDKLFVQHKSHKISYYCTALMKFVSIRA